MPKIGARRWLVLALFTLSAQAQPALLEGIRQEGAIGFLGLPFAQAERFAPPRLLPLGPARATQPGPVCPQDLAGLIPREGIGPFFPPQDENCLNLNLYLPAGPPPEVGWPVMVFIPGGAFLFGGGGLYAYQGWKLARLGVIVVTLNYRLGALGFLPWEGTANLGLLDQIAALEWVKAHIRAFGGDPDRVVVFGESAGGASICALLASPRARGLFQAAILESPALGCEAARPLAEGLPIGRKILEELGCQDLDCLRRLPLGHFLPQTTPSPTLRRHLGFGALDLVEAYAEGPFRPYLDGEVLPKAPLEALRQGEAKGIPLILGYNAEETRFYLEVKAALSPLGWQDLEARMRQAHGDKAPALLAYYQARFPSPGSAYGAWATDRLFVCPVMQMAQAQAPWGPIYLYRFRFQSPDLPQTGAFHALELAPLFGNYTDPVHLFYRFLFLSEPAVEAVETLGARMRRYWVNLAQQGEPKGWPRWPDWRAEGLALDLDLPPGLIPHPEPEVCRLME